MVKGLNVFSLVVHALENLRRLLNGLIDILCHFG